jgi:hypothetical protein
MEVKVLMEQTEVQEHQERVVQMVVMGHQEHQEVTVQMVHQVHQVLMEPMVVLVHQEVTVQMVHQEQVDYQIHFLTIKQTQTQQVVTLVQDIYYGITQFNQEQHKLI